MMTLLSRRLSNARLWIRSDRRCFHLSPCPLQVRVCLSKLHELKHAQRKFMGFIRTSEVPLANLLPLALEVCLFANHSRLFKEGKMTKIVRAGWIDSTLALRADPQNSEDNIHRHESEAILSSRQATLPIRRLVWKLRGHLNPVNQTIAECSVR